MDKEMNGYNLEDEKTEVILMMAVMADDHSRNAARHELARRKLLGNQSQLDGLVLKTLGCL
jgi:hypothetical protein